VTASIGIALNTGFDTVDEVLRNADVAMYTVKDSGRARYEFFAEEMHTAVVNRVELEHQLRAACDEDQFLLHYQPIVSLDTGRVVGVEALIRWQHPTRGLLTPADFIAAANDTGAIIPIGSWVLHTACHQAREWHDRHPDRPVIVSVNLSPLQVFQPDVVHTVHQALDHAGLAPNGLALELTEQVMFEDAAGATQRLQELKDLGIRLAIDDFGTGYSSLNYLRRLPFSVLKIDKTFIDGLTSTSNDSVFGKLIIDLASSLGLRTVAEGVEHAEQAAMLRTLGCHTAQGYLFSKPVPAPELDTLFTTTWSTSSWTPVTPSTASRIDTTDSAVVANQR
jgi:EAL domain-containing protein (putative c-di-GMP-specific phosphodiesterase class I)